jgi:hypothetical protein
MPVPAPARRPLRAGGALLLAPAVAASLAACGSDPTGPTDTSRPVTSTPTASPGRTLTAAQYLGAALDTIQGISINQAVSTTAAFRAKYVQQGASATTYRQTYPVIQRALQELDPHSSISTPENLPGSTDAPVDRPELRVQGRMATSRLAYVWVPEFVGRSQQGRVDSTHQMLRQLDANQPCGWIVDLRGNRGGYFFALMASVGPLYTTGDGRVGGQRYWDGFQSDWFYRQRANGTDAFVVRAGSDSGVMNVQNPWRPRRQGLPVAVLHGFTRNGAGQLTSITASAGESITLALRGGPPSRSFGAPTYGVASGRYPSFMIDSARIDITHSYMYDRSGFTPGDNPIAPDVTVPFAARATYDVNDEVVNAAVAWLQTQAACTGAAPDRSVTPRANVVPRFEATRDLPDGGRRLPNPRSVYDLPDVTLRLH